ncbi:hypothetical protein [Kitasatospora albolonga]
MTTGNLWRLDRRRRVRVWCARHPWLPYDPARIRAAVAAAAVAAFLLTGVAAAGAGQLAGADRSRAGLEAAWSGLVLLSALAGFSVTAVRDALMVPDAVLLRGCRCRACTSPPYGCSHRLGSSPWAVP